KKFERKTLDSADTIICVSSYCKKILENQFGIPCDKVIYNGVDPGFFKRNNDIVKNNKKITLFFSGNHTRMKGFDVVLEIATRLKNDVQIILSSGFKQNRIEKLSSNIISVGTLSRNEMVYYYNKSDIFLFPTRLEGCSLTVTEAMASEMPIIATNCASLPEQVDHGKGGMLCKMDDVDDFVKNIQYISEDEELRYQMGRYNRRKVLEMFADTQMAENYISEYQRLV
ncbi:MAG: glycosyltransferase family 4 protein, partial [Crenarchaeota archaeon]|nr:glycosyltransferase family 4 protein [Thermoproteota archaeon]